MAAFEGKLSLQFVIHLANQYTVNQLVELAELAHRRGFERIWVNDNARYRSQVVVLSAITARVPIGIGTAVLVPYLHHPIEVVDSLAALSELSEGREVGFGIARGDLAQTPQHVDVHKPIALVRELAVFVRRALAGESVSYGDFPVLCEYYHLNPAGRFKLAFTPKSPVVLYSGGNGPRSLRMGGQVMDGLISSGTFIPMLRAGRLRGMHEMIEAGARSVDPDKPLRKMVELNVSVSQDRDAAIEFPKRQVSHSILQWEALNFTPEEYARLGVERQKVLDLKDAFARGATVEEAAGMVTEKMVLDYYVAGRPEEVADQIVELAGQAQELGYDEIAFAKLGPDYEEAIEMLAESVMPRLRG
ncbi:MAG: LLM class flavin-dependent oxidoreductase [Deltaproteobacteria bacterium]|nr:LLM class flavin-dependent oxidoreductase [Deltaproteobacteria bacterium]